jgi:hypothetical protein
MDMVVIENFENALWSRPVWERDDDSTTWSATGYFNDDIYDLVVIGGPNNSDEPATCEVYVRRGETRVQLHSSDEENWDAATNKAENFVQAIAAEASQVEKPSRLDISQIPTAEFPLNWSRYNHLMDELRDAARGFARLGEMGWPGGKDLDRRLMTIWSDLSGVWETIQETERQMRAGTSPSSDG